MTFVVGVPYRFVITNTSKTPHEFAIAPPMPMGQAMSDAEMRKAALLHVDANQLPNARSISVGTEADLLLPGRCVARVG